MAPWVTQNLGRKVTMVFPEYAFGHDHRDFFSAAVEAQRGEMLELIAIPPTETSFTRYFPRIPRDTEVLYHVMVGPAVLTLVKELGEFYGSGDRPQIFGFIDSLEAVPIDSPGHEFLEGTHFWEGHPRYVQPDSGEAEAFYREAVGVDANGASTTDPRDVSTYAHMFSTWETLFTIRDAMQAAGYQGPGDRQAFVEAMEAITDIPYGQEHPQGAKVFNGRTHQVFGPQFISRVEDGRLTVVHTAPTEDGLYEDEVDYTTQPF
jgi:branched-chain amino acid transport system substrate-binding protein